MDPTDYHPGGSSDIYYVLGLFDDGRASHLGKPYYTQEDITSIYLSMQAQHDRDGTSPEEEAQFELERAAYAIFSDPVKRQLYDAARLPLVSVIYQESNVTPPKCYNFDTPGFEGAPPHAVGPLQERMPDPWQSPSSSEFVQPTIWTEEQPIEDLYRTLKAEHDDHIFRASWGKPDLAEQWNK